jgi:hypothetical protein
MILTLMRKLLMLFLRALHSIMEVRPMFRLSILGAMLAIPFSGLPLWLLAPLMGSLALLWLFGGEHKAPRNPSRVAWYDSESEAK